MKKLLNKSNFANIMALMALTITTMAANSRCVYIFHQPKQTSKIMELRKY